MRAQVVRVAMVVLLWPLAACGASQQAATPRSAASDAPNGRTTRTTVTPSRPYEDENSVGMEQERVSKWRWKGDRRECYFVAGNQCFMTRTEACAEARCGGRRCEVEDEGAPARVRCQGDESPTDKANADRQAVKERNEKARGEFDDSKFVRKKRVFKPEKNGDGDGDGRRRKKRRRRD